MQHRFSQVSKAEIPRSTFDRSHGHKTTFDAGWLIPFFVDEALPGDTFNVRSTLFARLATPIFPLMDNMYLDTHFFSVPHRLVWDNWQKFNGEQKDPGDSTDFLVPQTASINPDENSIWDYFGLPMVPGQVNVSALPFRAYNLIWNEWFRDQNLQNSLTVPTNDGADNPNLYTLKRRGKRHDYFTSCLPWPQKGEGVQIPLGTSAPVFPATVALPTTANGDFRNSNTSGVILRSSTIPGDSDMKMFADLSQATAATINSLRQAFQIQKIFERDARGGTRYTEILKAHFGVTSPDARLQRPEYLGGGSTPIGINPVPQTSGTAGTGAYTPSPQGNLAAYGTALGNNHGFTMSFTEHCTIIGLVSVRADLTYQQGLNRMWTRRGRFDFYWPALSHIGEQVVRNDEIFCAGGGATADLEAFGYQERYAEYRYKPSMLTGRMRSSSAVPLDAWHLSQEFLTRPTLSSAFIEEDPPIDRVIAVPAEPHFILDTYTNMHCARPMPLYGVPGMMDHF